MQFAAQYEWLRSYLSHEGMKELIGDDWRDEYHLERVEFPNIFCGAFCDLWDFGERSQW